MGRNPQSQLKRAREQALKERRERKEQKKAARALGGPVDGAPIRPSDEIVLPNVPESEATPTPEPALTPAEPSST
jgi:hypothetical protein